MNSKIISLGTISEAKQYFQERDRVLNQAEELFAAGVFGLAIVLMLYAAFLWTMMIF